MSQQKRKRIKRKRGKAYKERKKQRLREEIEKARKR